MRVFTTEQIYRADACTIEKQGITSDALMERAGEQVFNWLHAQLNDAPKNIHIFCGVGNNGGDGLVVGRHMVEHGYPVFVYIVNYGTNYSKDFLINLERLKDRKVWPFFLDKDADSPKIGEEDVIVDAIFGIGLNREPEAWISQLIATINHSKAFVLSIDVPSGLFMDQVPKGVDSAVKANHVLSFQVPKLNFFLPQTGVFLDSWEVLDIGLDADYIVQTETDYELIEKHEVRQFYMPRKRFSHKGTFGHSLIIGGSHGKNGAVILASKACLKSGSGLVTAYLPLCGLSPIQSALPEVMAITDADGKIITRIAFDLEPTVIGIGMGMGTDERTQKAFIDFLNIGKTPLVIDADALNILSVQQEHLHRMPPQAVLTPHPKELERLIGTWKDDFDKLEKTKAFSIKYNCIVVIKGAYTITVYNNKGYINSTGNPGMATAGSGDVLTGIITGLIAQGYPPLNASILGVYLHGRAGDLAVVECGYQALTAQTIIAFLGKAFLDLYKDSEFIKG